VIWHVAMAVFVLLGLWILLLWWLCTPLPGEKWPILFLDGNSRAQTQDLMRQYGFVRNFGIRLVIIAGEELKDAQNWLESSVNAEIWTPEEYLRYLETERNRIAGTGNGDHPGRDQRRGLSEL